MEKISKEKEVKMKQYTVKFSEKDIALLLEIIDNMGAQKKSTPLKIIQRKIYKAIGL